VRRHPRYPYLTSGDGGEATAADESARIPDFLSDAEWHCRHASVVEDVWRRLRGPASRSMCLERRRPSEAGPLSPHQANAVGLRIHTVALSPKQIAGMMRRLLQSELVRLQLLERRKLAP
jgi:hypothetical protein